MAFFPRGLRCGLFLLMCRFPSPGCQPFKSVPREDLRDPGQVSDGRLSVKVVFPYGFVMDTGPLTATEPVVKSLQ